MRKHFAAIPFLLLAWVANAAASGRGPLTLVIAPGPSAGGPQRKALVEGVLSLHGADRTIVVPATIRYDNGTLTAEGSVDLTYSDYSIAIPRFLWLVMEDDIKVRFRFVAAAAR